MAVRVPDISEAFSNITVFGSIGWDRGTWRYGLSLFVGDECGHAEKME